MALRANKCISLERREGNRFGMSRDVAVILISVAIAPKALLLAYKASIFKTMNNFFRKG